MKQLFASTLLIITGLFGLAVGAKAETHPEVVVKLPYQFVVAGHTLPAGTYTVSRLSDDSRSVLSIVSYEQRTEVFVVGQFEDRPGEDAKVLLNRVGDMYYLTSVTTLNGVYTFSSPHAALLMAKSAHTTGMSASGAH